MFGSAENEHLKLLTVKLFPKNSNHVITINQRQRHRQTAARMYFGRETDRRHAIARPRDALSASRGIHAAARREKRTLYV